MQRGSENSPTSTSANGPLFSFRGRLDRAGYARRGGVLLLGLAAMWGAAVRSTTGPDPSDWLVVGLFCGVLSIAPAVLLLFWSIQRLHDTGLRGWWLCLLPPLALMFPLRVAAACWLLAMLGLALLPGMAGANRFDRARAPMPSAGVATPGGAPAQETRPDRSTADDVGTALGVGVASVVLGGIAVVAGMGVFLWYCITHIRV